ncbi:hypothetical protein [Halochromatium roseum]|uniref:hypothetical protein n=1 Tax=Halochromatium roseum TaxID=391920 RepID=UPI00191128A4|nr:hypothetical protein [Halochromatium roseum]
MLELRQDMLARFAQVDKRFEQVDKRFDEMLKRQETHFLWILGFIATGVGLVITAMRYLPGLDTRTVSPHPRLERLGRAAGDRRRQRPQQRKPRAAHTDGCQRQHQC